MITADVSKILEDLKKYHEEVERKLKHMVVKFSYLITQEAINNTPLGDYEKYKPLYDMRTDLERRAGFARGSWQANTSGQFSIQEKYSGSDALSLVQASLGSYKLGDDVYIGNTGPYIKLLENNYSEQTNEMGIMKPTTDAIFKTYQVDLKRLFDEG